MSPHAFSETCQEEGVTFVMAVNKILNPDSKAAEEFDKTQVMQCPLKKRAEKGTPEEAAQNNAQADPEKEKEFRQAMEDKMLCEVMCCCDRHPAKSLAANQKKGRKKRKKRKKSYHQTCVKDIFDRVNGIRDKDYNRYEQLPLSRYTAELSINEQDYKTRGYMLAPYVGHGIMNPQGNTKEGWERLVRPDMAILGGDFTQEGGIALTNIERFVEMKFPTEDGDRTETIKQLLEYWEFGRPVHLMQRCTGEDFKEKFYDELIKKFEEEQRKILAQAKKDIENTNVVYTKHMEDIICRKDKASTFVNEIDRVDISKEEKISTIMEYMQIEIKCCNCLGAQNSAADVSQAEQTDGANTSMTTGSQARAANQAALENKKTLTEDELRVLLAKLTQLTNKMQQQVKEALSAPSMSAQRIEEIYDNLKNVKKCIMTNLDKALDAAAVFDQKKKKKGKGTTRPKKELKIKENNLSESLKKNEENPTELGTQACAALRFKAELAIVEFLSRSKYIPKG